MGCHKRRVGFGSQESIEGRRFSSRKFNEGKAGRVRAFEKKLGGTTLWNDRLHAPPGVSAKELVKAGKRKKKKKGLSLVGEQLSKGVQRLTVALKACQHEEDPQRGRE